MPNSVVESIDIQKDTEDVRWEWDLLVKPLALAINSPVQNSPDELYIEKTSNSLPSSNFPPDTIQLPCKNWDSQYEFLISNDAILPLILLADIGVGKTSWIEWFKSHLNKIEKVFCYYYNHHTEKGRPDGSHLNPKTRLNCFLYANLLEKIQEACCKYGLAGLGIKNYKIVEAASNPKYIDLEMTKSIEEACFYLKEKNVRIFFIIDNLDEYSRAIQIKAIEIANYMSKLGCIYPIISLRPETYHRTEIRLLNSQPIEIKPVSLNDILNTRFQYLWKNGGNDSIKYVLDVFEKNNMSLSVLWNEDVFDNNPDILKNLHRKIINVLADNKILEEALQNLHNYNMRKILAIVSKLLLSGFFSERIIEEFSSKSSGKLSNDSQSIITTYLRGPYLRYRGGNSNDYPVKMLNIFDISGIENDNMLVSVRIMQILGKANSQGLTVKKIIEDLGRIGYSESDITTAIKFLAKFAFILDIKEQKPWVRNDDEKLDNDDIFILAHAGNYLMTKLFDDFAFRYCEAMADVMRRYRPDSVSWKKEKDYPSLVENVIGILKFIVSASEYELKRILELGDPMKTKQDKFEEFKKNFLAPDVIGNEFLKTITEECKKRAEVLASHYRTYADFEGQKRLKTLKGEIYSLVDKALCIFEGKKYFNNNG